MNAKYKEQLRNYGDDISNIAFSTVCTIIGKNNGVSDFSFTTSIIADGKIKADSYLGNSFCLLYYTDYSDIDAGFIACFQYVNGTYNADCIPVLTIDEELAESVSLFYDSRILFR